MRIDQRFEERKGLIIIKRPGQKACARLMKIDSSTVQQDRSLESL